jgi:competence protein ComEA
MIILTQFCSAQTEVKTWQVLENCRLVDWSSNDGDSFLIAHQNKDYVLRLYFVDALESHSNFADRLQDQARYFQIETDQVIQSGQSATDFTKRFLSGEFTVYTKWLEAGGTSRPRYYALVQNKAGFYLSEALVSNGLARIYGMPTKELSPGGLEPGAYLKKLNQTERIAQQSNQGVWQLANNPDLRFPESTDGATIAGPPITPPITTASTPSGRINVNTASIGELETLPGIGPALAARIVAARPIASIEALSLISGISASGAAELTPLVKVEEPPPPPKSAALYLDAPDEYLNTQVTVLVKSVAISQKPSPDGFRSVLLDTGAIGTDGGSITAFIPEAFYDTFLNYYQTPGREFKGLFYKKDGETVLVYPRQ